MRGLSLTSFSSELFCYLVSVAYNIKHGYAFSTFGDTGEPLRGCIPGLLWHAGLSGILNFETRVWGWAAVALAGRLGTGCWVIPFENVKTTGPLLAGAYRPAPSKWSPPVLHSSPCSAAICALQNAAIIGLIFRLGTVPRATQLAVSIALAATGWWLFGGACPPTLLTALQTGSVALLALGGRLPQVRGLGCCGGWVTADGMLARRCVA